MPLRFSSTVSAPLDTSGTAAIRSVLPFFSNLNAPRLPECCDPLINMFADISYAPASLIVNRPLLEVNVTPVDVHISVGEPFSPLSKGLNSF